MSETTNLKLKKHDNVETNTEKFDIENYLNGNWDKIDENVEEVNTEISNIKTEKAKLETELKEMQEDFYQNSIRGQASGEYIHVEDSSNCRAKIGISGNSEQETREGKNRIKKMSSALPRTWVSPSSSFGQMYISYDDEFINNYKQGFTIKVKAKNILDKAFSQFVLGNSDWTRRAQYTEFSQREKDGYKIYEYYTTSTDFELLSNNYFLMLFEDHSQKTGCDLYDIEVDLGNTVGQDFEAYGAMPSPDYPSEVRAVGSNVNIFDGLFENGDLNSANGSDETNASRIRSVNYIEVEEKQDITFSPCNASRVVMYDKDKNFLNCLYNVSLIKTVSKTKYIRFSILTTDVNWKEKIEKGTVATPWSPHGQGCIKVTKCNKNILKNIATSGALNGVTRTVNEDKSVTINGTSTGWANLTVGTIKGDGNSYTLSGSLSNSEIFLSVNNSQEGDIAQSKNGNEITFIPKRGLTYNVIICIPSGKTFNNVLIKPLVRISSDKDNTYEQHKEQSYIMPIQAEMLKNDYFDYDNEEEVHTWGKVVLDGVTYGCIYMFSNGRFFLAEISTKTLVDGGKKDADYGTKYSNYIYCTHLSVVSIADEEQRSMMGIAMHYNGTQIIKLDSATEDTNTWTKEKINEYLKEQYDAGTPITIYYQLETPTRLAFTDEQKAVAKELNNARTYKNVTNITTDSKAILSLDYAKDLETLLTSKVESEV